MTVEVFRFEQRSPEWFQARMGIPTASEFSTVMARGKDGGDSRTRALYLRKLAGELITGEPMENYSNAHMERGREQEDDARNAYALVCDEDVDLVGFIRNGRAGASPDGLVGSNGTNEIKCVLPHVLVEHIDRGAFPAEHVAQCQGVLWVSEREWIDLVIYSPKMRLFVKRAYRDEVYLKRLDAAVKAFNDELSELVERVRKYGVEPTLPGTYGAKQSSNPANLPGSKPADVKKPVPPPAGVQLSDGRRLDF